MGVTGLSEAVVSTTGRRMQRTQTVDTVIGGFDLSTALASPHSSSTDRNSACATEVGNTFDIGESTFNSDLIWLVASPRQLHSESVTQNDSDPPAAKESSCTVETEIDLLDLVTNVEVADTNEIQPPSVNSNYVDVELFPDD